MGAKIDQLTKREPVQPTIIATSTPSSSSVVLAAPAPGTITATSTSAAGVTSTSTSTSTSAPTQPQPPPPPPPQPIQIPQQQQPPTQPTAVQTPGQLPTPIGMHPVGMMPSVPPYGVYMPVPFLGPTRTPPPAMSPNRLLLEHQLARQSMQNQFNSGLNSYVNSINTQTASLNAFLHGSQVTNLINFNQPNIQQQQQTYIDPNIIQQAAAMQQQQQLQQSGFAYQQYGSSYQGQF